MRFEDKLKEKIEEIRKIEKYYFTASDPLIYEALLEILKRIKKK